MARVFRSGGGENALIACITTAAETDQFDIVRSGLNKLFQCTTQQLRKILGGTYISAISFKNFLFINWLHTAI